MPKNDEARYYDLCLHAYPEGASTVSRLALLARNYGYSGIGISNHSDFFDSVGPRSAQPEDFKVIQGVEIYAKNGNELRKLVDRYRSRVDGVDRPRRRRGYQPLGLRGRPDRHFNASAGQQDQRYQPYPGQARR